MIRISVEQLDTTQPAAASDRRRHTSYIQEYCYRADGDHARIVTPDIAARRALTGIRSRARLCPADRFDGGAKSWAGVTAT